MKHCKPAARFCVALFFVASSVFAALSTAPPPCPNRIPPPLPAECNISGANHGWAAAVNCLNALTRDYPTYFQGAILGSQYDGGAPLLYANGLPGSGFETHDVTRIASIASMTKPITYAAALKLIQDHMSSPDCAILADGTRNSACIFPNGVDSRLNIVLLRLDKRNGTDTWRRWFTNSYLQAGSADIATYDEWKHSTLRIRDLFLMTSGFPTLQFGGHFFCLTDGCGQQQPGDVPCARSAWDHAAPHTSECGYSHLYNSYLELRGGNGALPDACRPRPSTGPRRFDFDTYYGGVVYDPTRMQQQFERRNIGEPFIFNDCVYTEDPATGTGSWIGGRKATAREVAMFDLGLPLEYEPGTSSTYAQANLHILSYIIEELSGFSWNVYVKQKLLVPIGMTDTFMIPEKNRPVFAPGGALHQLSHASPYPWDHSADEGGTDPQYARILDIKRVPTTPPRDIPDVAPGLVPASALGPDKHWDEGRYAWKFVAPEGAGYSTASDVLKFLRFLRNGRANDGSAILLPYYLDLLTNQVSPISHRTYGFGANGDRIGHSGFFGSVFERDKTKGLNTTVIPQSVMSTPHGGAQRVPLCELTYGDRQRFIGAIENLLQCDVWDQTKCLPPSLAAAGEEED